ncbi:MAG: amidohydrolase/deacetylase family metallohydrolase [Acidobacteria bacterium]|nr:amidohydrolase/deacetylase family metallohydrolase [Acidobacteriota bacterium]MDA1235601.1 amidohydrolase/deacetylase family metallohydrolase [Acidobacteriota bacterium]
MRTKQPTNGTRWYRLAMLLLMTLATAPAQQSQYDLLLKGGYVIDPRNGISGRRDVAITGGVIAAVEESIDASRAVRTVDVSELYITPGLVDLHVHVFSTTNIPDAWAGDNSLQPDVNLLPSGVTTAVDAGSSGWRNFEFFRHTVIDKPNVQTRILALINIAGLGMITDLPEQGDFNAEEVARLAAKHKDVVVGVKSAHYQLPDWKSVDEALKAGTTANIPVMVDFGFFLPERPFYELVLERLRPGDMPTHVFRGPVPWVDANGKLYDYLSQARDRGIKFDVGHGGGSFVFRSAVPAVQQGFYPDSISTDLHVGSAMGGMMDMQTTMSKFLAMGMPLDAVIEASTWNPAQQIHREELGHLTPGAVADIAGFRILEGRHRYRDASNGVLEGPQRLFCELTLRAGRIVWDWNSVVGVDYESLPPEYGVREGVDQIIPPPQ